MRHVHSWVIRVVSACVILISLGLASNHTAGAATPSSGTVDSSTPAQWDFAAVAQSQPTDLGIEQTCPAVVCDNYDLTVNAGTHDYTKESWTLTIKYTWTPSDPVSQTSGVDMDVFAILPDGSQLGPGHPDVTSGGPGEEDLTISDPVSGVYHIRSLCANCPVPEAAHAVATLTVAPLPPATTPYSPTPKDPGFTNYAAPSSLPNSDNAGEPSIGTNWKTDNVLYQSYTSTYRVNFNTPDGTPTWADASAPNTPISLDPILYTDSPFGWTVTAHLVSGAGYADGCSLSGYTGDDGQSWTPGQGCGVPGGSDHETLGGGPYSPNWCCIYPNATHPIPDAIYYCAQDIPTPVTPVTTAFCSRSDNGGLTYGPGIPVYTSSQCGGIHGHIKVAPDGTVYVPNQDCHITSDASGNPIHHQGVAVSSDSDSTPGGWTIKEVPDSTPPPGGGLDPSVGVAKNDTGRPCLLNGAVVSCSTAGSKPAAPAVYFGYVNGDGHPKIAVSHDGGNTWSRSVDVGIPYGIQNTEFPAVVAGDDNRASFAFLGTTTPGNDQAPNFGCPPGTAQATTSCPGAVWHLYVATTYDGGQTWTTVDATPNDPVQRGCIWNSGGSNACRNLLDFIDASVDKQGRVVVGYADGCIGKCVTSDEAQYRPGCPTSLTGSATGPCDAYATIARQTQGKGLFSAYAPLSATYAVAGQPTTFTANQGSTYQVTVTNNGTETWPASGTGQVRLGIHFLDSHGNFVTDQQYLLPNNLATGQSATLTVTVNPPTVNGPYTLQYRMVQDGVGWFDQYRNENVSVTGGTTPPADAAAYQQSGQPSSMPRGTTAPVQVTVTNKGTASWPAGGSNPVELGVRFIDPNTLNPVSSQTFTLPSDVPSGGSATLGVTIAAPKLTGNYIVEYRLLRYGTHWFDQYLDVSITLTKH